MPCKHSHTHFEAEEESRIYGNNFDIVTIMLHEYCDACEEHVGHQEITKRRPPIRFRRTHEIDTTLAARVKA